jgi:hypothetical protein
MTLHFGSLLHFDKLNPPEKLSFLANTEDCDPSLFLYECHSILIAMHALDEVLRKTAKNGYFYYVQDDQSLITLFNRINMPLATKGKAFAALGLSQHLYRFNAAKKFGLGGDIKQLRLNSWGREYLAEQGMLDLHGSLHLTVKSWFESYVAANKEIYRELLEILLKPIDASSSSRIGNLNRNLDIRLLS